MKHRVETDSELLVRPFTQSLDGVDRADLAKNMTALFSNLEQGSVSILNGRWGVGKSTFVRRWVNSISELGFGTIYFDAFQNDYFDTPFDALSSSILMRWSEVSGDDSINYKEFLSSAASVSKKLGVISAKALLRVATLSAIDAEDGVAAFEAVKEGVNDAGKIADDFVKDYLESQSKNLLAFNLFRENLSKIHEATAAHYDDQLPVFKKTLLVIDELDRCRPDFSLGILEVIKHFFHADGLHILLVTNKAYLQDAVAHRYGLRLSSGEYLEKFYDFEITFEAHARHSHTHSASVYADRIIHSLMPESLAPNITQDIARELSEIAFAYDLTLRNVEKIATNVALAYFAFDRRDAYTWVVVYLCFFKSRFPKVYEAVRFKRPAYDLVVAAIDQGNWGDSSTDANMKKIFQYHLDPDIDVNAPEWRGFRGSGFFNRLDWLSSIANGVLETFSR